MPAELTPRQVGQARVAKFVCITFLNVFALYGMLCLVGMPGTACELDRRAYPPIIRSCTNRDRATLDLLSAQTPQVARFVAQASNTHRIRAASCSIPNGFINNEVFATSTPERSTASSL